MTSHESRFVYLVSCEFDDVALRRIFEDWLKHEHIREVLAAGAVSAEIFRYDVESKANGAAQKPRLDILYRFASRASFDAYERDHAPRLRESGKQRFPYGVSFVRQTGMTTATLPNPNVSGIPSTGDTP